MESLPATIALPKELQLLFQERDRNREWIAGRAITLLSHYWRDDDPVEMTAAIGKDWADVLDGLSPDMVQRACIEYQRREPKRKPTPAAIYAIAQDMMPLPVYTPGGKGKE